MKGRKSKAELFWTLSRERGWGPYFFVEYRAGGKDVGARGGPQSAITAGLRGLTRASFADENAITQTNFCLPDNQSHPGANKNSHADPFFAEYLSGSLVRAIELGNLFLFSVDVGKIIVLRLDRANPKLCVFRNLMG